MLSGSAVTANPKKVDAMQVELPLDKMTLADKLQTMEALWEDLSRKADQLPSPEWHREELQQRRLLVAEGKLRFQDWDTAMAELRSELRDNPAS